ncbi:hypothetical protein KPL37_05305 [Clostridium frigoris]|uniref:Uncharacterized protein n=1 Tax=Clostridium frigoris TaxID=205327 RepID=A0ABS6BQH1_9CLOT|nr:hypothetical protein [Clostridium frigoris]MBU3159173.1 hypothetical protein [Clostridium frigoris]
MNYLRTFSKINKYKQKKQKVTLVKGIAIFSVIGIAIGGFATRLLAQSHLDEKKEATINGDYKNGNEDINIKRDEIKHTLEEFGDEVVGDVGMAMEKALEGLEDKKHNENEIKE